MKLLSCLFAVSPTCPSAAQARFGSAARQAALLMRWLDGEQR